MAEFNEIAHAGGRLEFHKESGLWHTKYVHSKPTPLKMYQVSVSHDGRIIDTIGFKGMGVGIDLPPSTMLALMVSDENGMYGRKCPACGSYFRTDFVDKTISCPYCGRMNPNVQFTTDNQLEFLTRYCNTIIGLQKKEEDFIVDLDQLAKELPDNSKGWVYKEEEQQTQSVCSACKTKFDILGDYGYCPSCNLHNSDTIFNMKMDQFKADYATVNAQVTDRHQREEQWEKLLRCVSEFESMANSIKSYLLKLPLTPKRRADLTQLSFQRILNCNDAINNWYGFEILAGINDEDRTFMNKMFNRRHLFTHKAGQVDQEYLTNTGDTTVKLHQKIRLHSNEIIRLIDLIQKAGNNIIEGYKSIDYIE